MTVTATFSGHKTYDGSHTVLSGSAQNKRVMVDKSHDYLLHQLYLTNLANNCYSVLMAYPYTQHNTVGQQTSE